MTARPEGSPTFALVAEGPTDFELLRHLLAGYFNDPDIVLNLLQPKPHGDEPGGWHQVLRYCESDDFRAAFGFVDHVIVQIDTDVCEEPGFDVRKRNDQGQELDPDALIVKVRERLLQAIGEDFYQAHEDAILFAIAVESMECWLLPAAFPSKPKKAAKTKNCLGTLNESLGAKAGFSIDPKSKQVRYYSKALRALDRKRKLHTLGGRNPSLGVFIEQLDGRFQGTPQAPEAP